MRTKPIFLIVCLLASSLLAVAEERPGDMPEPSAGQGQVSLPSLVRLGLERSPRIQAARARWQATIEKIPEAKALPDPKVTFDYFGESVQTRTGPQEYRYGVSQSFPWPGTLGQAGEVAAREVAIKHAEYDRAIRDVIVDLKISYHEVLYLRGALTITRQNQELLHHIMQVTNTRYAAGNAKLADLLKAQSQLAQLSYDVILLRELEQVEVAKINAMLDQPSSRPLGDLTTPPVELVRVPIETLEESAVANRQEVDIAQAVVDKAEEAIRLAKLKNRPTFSLNAMQIATGEAQMDSADSGKDPWLVGIGLSIPLWFDSNRSRVKAAEYEHEAAMSNKRMVENETRSELKSVYFRLENARRLIELYEKSLIPQAKQAMEVAEQWNDGETKDVSGFLETQGIWLNFTLARLRAVTDYQQQKARLERLLGGPVPTEEATP